MFIAHAPISFFANSFLQRKAIKKLKLPQQIWVGIFALFFGILPDFDLFYLMMKEIPPFTHHEYFTHTPIFYIGIWVVMKILFFVFGRFLSVKTKKILNTNFIQILLNTFLIGTLFHLFADFLYSEIMLFYPLSTNGYTVLKYILEPSRWSGSELSVLFSIEFVICAFFVIYVLNILFQRSIFTKILSILGITLSFGYFFFSIYVDVNTYNRSYMYDSKGVINYDTDYDGLKDSEDMDVDNDGKDNIVDISTERLVQSTKNIVESKKWTTSEDGSYRYILGGLDSYRLVSQAYFDIHSSIEPVLNDLYSRENGFNKYAYEYDHEEYLYKYFSKKGLVKNITEEKGVTLESGKIFFILNESNKVVNIGITMENNTIGIVMPTDQNLTIHSYKEVVGSYRDTKTFISL